jgi:hypothetical protein
MSNNNQAKKNNKRANANFAEQKEQHNEQFQEVKAIFETLKEKTEEAMGKKNKKITELKNYIEKQDKFIQEIEQGLDSISTPQELHQESNKIESSVNYMHEIHEKMNRAAMNNNANRNKKN